MVTTIKANDFVLRIPTKQPKKGNHHIYGDKVIKIIDKSSVDQFYHVLWSDGTYSTVTKEYLQEFHRDILIEF